MIDSTHTKYYFIHTSYMNTTTPEIIKYTNYDDLLFIEIRDLLSNIYIGDKTHVNHHEWKLLNKKRSSGYIMNGTVIKYHHETYIFLNHRWILDDQTCNFSYIGNYIISFIKFFIPKLFR